MALKFKIGGSAYEALSADVKKEYKKEGDDYVLDLDGYEDPAELRRARDHEKSEAATAKASAAAEKARADKAERKVTDLEAKGANVDEKVAAKDAEWQTKYNKDMADKDTKINGMQDTVKNSHRDGLAKSLAEKISVSPSLLLPAITGRIEVEIGEDMSVKHYILNKDGKRTAGSMDDLEKELLKNTEYAPILRGTKGSGGGGAPSPARGGGAPQSPARPGFAPQPGTAPQDLTKLSAADFAAKITAEREAKANGGA